MDNKDRIIKKHIEILEDIKPSLYRKMFGGGELQKERERFDKEFTEPDSNGLVFFQDDPPTPPEIKSFIRELLASKPGLGEVVERVEAEAMEVVVRVEAVDSTAVTRSGSVSTVLTKSMTVSSKVIWGRAPVFNVNASMPSISMVQRNFRLGS